MGKPRRRSARVKLFETLENRRLLSGTTWTITGSDAANSILIGYKPGDPSRLRAIIDGQVISTRAAKTVSTIEVFGNAGNDRITIDLSGPSPDLAVWVNGGAGKDKIIGGAESDMFLGGSNRDTLIGGTGDDTLRGGTGNDHCLGDDGNGYLQGNAGNDSLSGGWGDDKLTGGMGNDQLRGGNDSDRLFGGQGDDVVKGGDSGDFIDGGAAPDTLFTQTGIDDVTQYADDSMQKDVLDEPLQRLESQDALRDWLIDNAVAQWSWALGKTNPDGGYWAYDNGSILRAASPVSLQSNFAALDSASSSTTNTQVQGVDEADVVETDGDKLYLLREGKLVIADATPAKDLHVVSSTDLGDMSPSGMYLSGSRLAVISDGSNYGIAWRGRVGAPIGIDSTLPIYQTPQTRVVVYDVSDAAAPKVTQDITFDGSMLDSRVVDGRLYLVTQNYLAAVEPKTTTTDSATTYESEADYRARLAAGDWKQMLPGYTGTSADGSTTSGEIISAPDVYVRAEDSLNFSTVSLIDLGSSVAKPVASTSAAADGGTIYASHDSLYLAGYDWESNNDRSALLKFGLGVDSVPLEASGTFAGQVLNSYSMDESGSFFRLASTYTSKDDVQANAVTVFDQVGDELNPSGQILGIAKGERIYAARFMGDRGYLVTFRQFDPLFSLDLSNPTKPAVAGQLELPGFSRYLYPIDENHLVGVGQDIKNNEPNGVKLSLFDVTDLAAPKEIDTYAFDTGDEFFGSPVLSDPHAFIYFPDQHMIALPLDKNSWSDPSAEVEKLALVTVDPAKGFTLAGNIIDKGKVQRSVRIGDELFSISTSGIRAFSFSDLTTEISHLDLPDDVWVRPWPVALGGINFE